MTVLAEFARGIVRFKCSARPPAPAYIIVRHAVPTAWQPHSALLLIILMSVDQNARMDELCDSVSREAPSSIS